MTTSKQLDAEIEALKPLWKQAAIDSDTCQCGAWNEGECGCWGYVDTGQYMLRREVAYLRARILKADA